jgi:hypothetical protein
MSDVGPARNVPKTSDAFIPPQEEFRIWPPTDLASERPMVTVDSLGKRIALYSNDIFGDEYLTIIGDKVILEGPERSRSGFRHLVPRKNVQTKPTTDPFTESSEADHRRQVALSQRLRAQFAAAVQENDPNDPEFDLKIAAFIDAMLSRYGIDSIEAYRDFTSDLKVSFELRHAFLLALARADHAETKDARRNLIASYLDSPEASVRYSAVLALGEMKSETSLVLLSNRKKVEQNRSVFNLIEAYLR